MFIYHFLFSPSAVRRGIDRVDPFGVIHVKLRMRTGEFFLVL